MEKGFYIFCDESVKQGRHYSNFYGGALVAKDKLNSVEKTLNGALANIGMEDSELKWSNINEFRVDAYIEMMEVLFGLLKDGLVKIRIMFTDNRNIPIGLKKDQRKIEYHLLYYQFIKHAFGFSHLESDYVVDLELFFDILPQTKKKNEDFKKYIFGLQFLPELVPANLRIRKDSIYEVDSKKHIILQCVDVVLGSMAFRLNDHHLDKPKGQYRRGKRTRAKERVYKSINRLIREVKPNFNVGVSTSNIDQIDKFTDAYRHWLFKPKESEFIGGSKNKKRP